MHIFQSINPTTKGVFFEIPTSIKNEIFASTHSNNLLSKINSVFTELNGCWPEKQANESEIALLDAAAQEIIDAISLNGDVSAAVDAYRQTALTVGRTMQER